MYLWSCITGPRLYRIYTVAVKQFSGDIETVYLPNSCERWGDSIVKGLSVMWNVGMYTSPLLCTYLYRRDYFCLMGCMHLGKFAVGMGMLLMFGMLLRGFGRACNPNYTEFLKALNQIQRGTVKDAAFLAKYDFEISAWPRDFAWDENEGEKDKPIVQVERKGPRTLGMGAQMIGVPCDLLSWLAVHLFGRHMMFPGSIHLLQGLMGPMLLSGREKLVTEHAGRRHKLQARDGNEIDSMIVDRRKSPQHANGNILVICCEGNAGFYEVGVMNTPLEAGYSVLGWNNPGFAGSTGQPFPSQLQNAVDIVMQFAIHRLGFALEDIVIYSWSIGGYPGTWAAMNYPEIRGLVLDATFDHVLPLAIPNMPSWMGGLVRRTIRNYLNLNNAEQLCRYPGPVTIVRRTKDEIITTRQGVLAANRGNNLLTQLLNFRYPNLFVPIASEQLQKWLAEDSRLQSRIYESLMIDSDNFEAQMVAETTRNGSFPSKLGDGWTKVEKTKFLIFLAQKLLVNFAETHNVPLKSQYFKIPWSPSLDSSFVHLE